MVAVLVCKKETQELCASTFKQLQKTLNKATSFFSISQLGLYLAVLQLRGN